MSDSPESMHATRRAWIGRCAAVLGVAVAGTAAGWWWRQRSQAGDTSPENAAAAALWILPWLTPTGTAWDPAPLRGKRVVVNFWAPWCPPCVEEMPMLDQFYQAHQGRGWVVLGVALDRPAAVQAFLRKNPVGFPIVMGGIDGMDWARSLGNAHGGLPFTVVLDALGQVQQRRLGRLQESHLRQWAELE